MTSIAIFGFLSGLLFCIAGFPAAYRASRAGRSDVPTLTTVCLWLGLLLGYVYLHAHNGFDPVVAIMYGVELITWSVVARYTFWPRKVRFHATMTEGVAVANPKALTKLEVGGPDCKVLPDGTIVRVE